MEKEQQLKILPSALSHLAMNPIVRVLAYRVVAGIVTLFMVSIIIFWATQVLPGNAATAILGQHATPQRIKLLKHQLHLDEGLISQYWIWATGILSGHTGVSFTTGQSVAAVVGPRILNSAVLMVVSGVISTLVGGALGVYAAFRKGRTVERILSIVMLSLAAVPEFITGVVLVLLCHKYYNNALFQHSGAIRYGYAPGGPF